MLKYASKKQFWINRDKMLACYVIEVASVTWIACMSVWSDQQHGKLTTARCGEVSKALVQYKDAIFPV